MLESLWVLNKEKKSALPFAVGGDEGLVSSFFLETCQRWVWVGNSPLDVEPRGSVVADEAYELLLRIFCGLESEVVAETDVLGQFKEGFRQYSETHPLESKILLPVFQKLFEDSKEIRTRFLQDMGNQSYGAMVRKELRDFSDQEVLLVGAGQLASSVLRYLKDFRVSLWNRTPEKAQLLMTELKNDVLDLRVVLERDLEKALPPFPVVVFCVPYGDDEKMISILKKSEKTTKVIHLGGLDGKSAPWRLALKDGFISLEDMFKARSELDFNRKRLLDEASRACREKARLRLLGGMYAHGWEDLMLFERSSVLGDSFR